MTFSEYVDRKVTIAVLKQRCKYAAVLLNLLLQQAQRSHQNFDEVLEKAPIDDDNKMLIRILHDADYPQESESDTPPGTSA